MPRVRNWVGSFGMESGPSNSVVDIDMVRRMGTERGGAVQWGLEWEG